MMLEQGIEPSNAYANFKKAIGNTEYLISHNIDFDIPIVHCDFLRNGMQWDFPNNKMLCTMKTGTASILFGIQFAWFERSYRKVREKATVIGRVGCAWQQQVLVKVTDGKRAG